jgi:hypothetical protein
MQLSLVQLAWLKLLLEARFLAAAAYDKSCRLGLPTPYIFRRYSIKAGFFAEYLCLRGSFPVLWNASGLMRLDSTASTGSCPACGSFFYAC